MRKIKRYGNRKFYDTDSRKYVTLSDIARIIRRGEDVEVVDHSTGQDITAQTLIQILTKANDDTPPLPLALLMALVRGGEGILLDAIEFSMESVLSRLGIPTGEDIENLKSALDELEERIEKLVEEK